MKTLSANIISSKPVSLSRAAKFLSNFVEYDNGASHAVSTYLRRTSDAFNELSEFHKKLYSSGTNHKSTSSKASSGIYTSHNELSTVSAWSSEGEKPAENSKGKSRKKGLDGDLSVSVQEIRVDRRKSELRHAHGEALGNDCLENLANGSEDNSEAVSEKKRKKKHKRKDQDDESVGNGGKAQERDGESNSRYNVSKGSEVDGDHLSEKSHEKKIKKKRSGEEGDDSLLENGICTGKKEISDGKCENNAFKGLEDGVVNDLSEKSSEKKRKKKKKKGEEGDNGLLRNGLSAEEKEISDGKLGSEEGKENSKKRKNEEIRTSVEVDGSVEHRKKKKAKRRMGTDQDS